MHKLLINAGCTFEGHYDGHNDGYQYMDVYHDPKTDNDIYVDSEGFWEIENADGEPVSDGLYREPDPNPNGKLLSLLGK